ncbi:MAG: hypothetical protein HC804_04000 [Anaerolineae bacterium]|nr:hypothetical protein [Anaerolineae bacterium]
MSEFSDYAADLILNEKLALLPEIFNLMEQFLVEGEPIVQDVTATCFLENLINRAGTTLDPKTFVHLLGPKSIAYCQAWDEFTGVYTEGLWRRRDVLGGSPLLQREDTFSLEEYKELVTEYYTSQEEYYSLSYQKPEHKERKDFLDRRLKILRGELSRAFAFYTCLHVVRFVAVRFQKRLIPTVLME